MSNKRPVNYYVANRIEHDYGGNGVIKSWHKLLGPYKTRKQARSARDRLRLVGYKYNLEPHSLDVVRRASESPAALNHDFEGVDAMKRYCNTYHYLWQDESKLATAYLCAFNAACSLLADRHGYDRSKVYDDLMSAGRVGSDKIMPSAMPAPFPESAYPGDA